MNNYIGIVSIEVIFLKGKIIVSIVVLLDKGYRR